VPEVQEGLPEENEKDEESLTQVKEVSLEEQDTLVRSEVSPGERILSKQDEASSDQEECSQDVNQIKTITEGEVVQESEEPLSFSTGATHDEPPSEGLEDTKSIVEDPKQEEVAVFVGLATPSEIAAFPIKRRRTWKKLLSRFGAK